MPVQILCSNCAKEFTSEESGGDPGGPYGVCEACSILFKLQPGPELTNFLETIPLPTLVVNPDLRVVAYNEKYLKNLSGGKAKSIGLLTGEFMDCQNALREERCGGSAACLDCAIRQTAVKTLKTGKPQNDVRAFLDQLFGGHKQRLELLLYTNKLGHLIQITIRTFFIVLEPPSKTP